MLSAGCTTRVGGVSKPPYDELNVGLHVGDDPRTVLENRRRLAEALGVELSSFVFAQQVHGGGVHVVSAADRGRGTLTVDDAIPDSDALLTREAGVVLAVLVADCVPVIIFDPQTPAIGVVHAGWRGTTRHIARAAIEAMRSEFGSDPSVLLAAVGPSIGPASYEVGVEVAEQVQAAFPETDTHMRAGVFQAGVAAELPAGTPLHLAPKASGPGLLHSRRGGKYMLDLGGANIADLLAAGVRRERIEISGLDTFQLSARFFSHRRRQPTGRFAAYAMLRD